MVDKKEISSELLAKLTALLFSELPLELIIKGRVRCDGLTAEKIAIVMLKDKEFNCALSESACKSFAKSAMDYVIQESRHKYRKELREDVINVFDLLLVTVQSLLTMTRNRVEVRYGELSSWRLLVKDLGEELLLSAMYALWDHENARAIRCREDEFSWGYVTPHNNKQLNAVLERGISDHHCHLAAATPYFHVSWINLMNRITDSEYQKNIEKLSVNKWPYPERTEDSVIRDRWGMLVQLRAAWLRLHFCTKLVERSSSQDEGKTKLGRVECTYDQEFEAVLDYDNWRRLLLSCSKLQSEIDAYAFTGKCKQDYALALAGLKRSEKKSNYQILLGERWLYYRVIREYLSPDPKLTPKDFRLFFLYIRLRLWIRKQMVQNNDLIGFDNFQKIERKKLSFLGDAESERYLMRLTVNETLKKPYMNELELRISPQIQQISRFDHAVTVGNDEDHVSLFLKATRKGHDCEQGKKSASDLRNRYYYVFHFLKRKDFDLEQGQYRKSVYKSRRICRNHIPRDKYMQEAERIVDFRERYPKQARRVLGIDAASNEEGCRPEVFGTVFRMLAAHQFVYDRDGEKPEKLPALCKTYHVGEDFHDVVDGLRAIDEAINFLELDCGDRLGHAMALGIDVEAWYKQRNRGISLPVQDYLDNLAWLNHALIHFSIPNTAALRERLKRDFDHWFGIVYRSKINENVMKDVMSNAEEYYKSHADRDSADRYSCRDCNFDIMSYFRAWTLRGDDPSCYVDGYFKKPNNFGGRYDKANAKVCKNFPRDYEERYVPEYSYLNYVYQFHDEVKREGMRKIKVDLTMEYILAVKEVQKHMRYRIAQRGISIETNPTSNVMIGTFRKYEEHPILRFFNRGLPVSEQEEQDCAQLQVSVNTDDCGVFYTDLEMEYALLAQSVENIRDDEDAPRFKKYDIYNWLDNIRVMGNDQSFRFRNEDQ